MTANHVSLRSLRLTDWKLCWYLASDPTVRAMSFDERPPTPWKHLRWMFQQRGRGFVIERQGIQAGVISVRRMSGSTYLGINLRPSERGKGLGSAALRLACFTLRWKGQNQVRALIKSENVASRVAFERAGFALDGVRPEGALQYRWSGRPSR